MKLFKLILVVLVAVGLLGAAIAAPSLNPNPNWNIVAKEKKGDGDIIGG